MKRSLFVLMILFFLLVFSITCLDRFFFKQNHSFCLRYIFSTLPYEKEWEIPPSEVKEQEMIDAILSQKFYYFPKGKQCFVFQSQDQKYVLKIYRFHSSLRPMPWLKHPLIHLRSSTKSKKRLTNFAHLQRAFNSYRDAYLDLKEETGVLFVHLNKTKELKKNLHLVDSCLVDYEVPANQLSFLLQKKGELLMPYLDRLTQKNDLLAAKKLIKEIVELFLTCTRKGYEDWDAVLQKNYGVIVGHPFILDFGSLHHITQQPYLKQLILIKTEALQQKLSKHPMLLEYYLQLVDVN